MKGGDNIMQEIVAMTIDYGVGVALAFGLAFILYKVFSWNREDSRDREERDRETITRLSEIVSTNSKALLQNAETMKEISREISEIGDQIETVKEDVQTIKIRQEQHKE